MKIAQEEYAAARGRAEHMLELARHTPPNNLDRHALVRNAIREERFALHRYTRALRRYMELALRRQFPTA